MGEGSDLLNSLKMSSRFSQRKLVYNTDDVLEYAALDGKKDERFQKKRVLK